MVLDELGLSENEVVPVSAHSRSKRRVDLLTLCCSARFGYGCLENIDCGSKHAWAVQGDGLNEQDGCTFPP